MFPTPRPPSQHVIATSRLMLRMIDMDDAAFMLRLLNEPGFVHFIGDKGVRTLEDAGEYIRRGPLESYGRFGFGLYLASLRDGSPIGICGLVKRDTLPDVDVGFAFLEEYWSRGYASEAAAAVLDYAKNRLGLQRVVAITALENHGSMAVLIKIGLRLEGRVRLAGRGQEVYLFGPG